MTAAVGYKGAEYTNYTSDPVVRNNASTAWGGSVKRYFFSYTVVTDLLFAKADCGELLRLKAGQRLFGGMISCDGVDAALDVGISGSGTKYGSALAAGNDTPTAFGNTIALNWGELLTADAVLRATAETVDIAADSIITGYLDVMETAP